ncbi:MULTISPECIES: hypothetical protein [Rhizobium]|uniref:hypothetical protein n=1 Tax=Rhizobium TaxID=379 RepID=UPI001A97DC7B|nr:MULTISPECIES: hypothetical protein [Rhizobium]MBX4892893.1 hypothetical protein [Rhizobium bangladeshense]MBX4917287.1 hypothetical protein [Rhizobium bangladeshense]MBX4922044.1 hypothetical protein [Rhizobium bangladeshense]MBX4935362.1 hypothetical protein [Rhizobium bangladeshense]MBX5013702.1 hypothetical protein [Rhizobium lentis]
MQATMQTNMRREVDQISKAAAKLLERLAKDFAAAGAALRSENTAFVVTVARSLSDHPAIALRCPIELRAKLPVSSIRPPRASIDGVGLNFGRGAALPRRPRARSR